MKSVISEFSYGYALTENLATNPRFAVVAAPVFPSLIQEGRQGGYDVSILLSGIPVFMQFKISEYLSRYNARESYLIRPPYYRFQIRSSRDSDQHSMLLDLESSGQYVYYAAPRFHTTVDFNTAYRNRKVLEQSLFLTPMQIGSFDDEEEHYIVFNDSKVFVCSEPREILEGFSYEHFLASLQNSIETSVFREHFPLPVDELVDLLIRIILKSEYRYYWKGIAQDDLHSNSHPLEQAAYLARTFFGSELIIAHPR